MIKSIKRYVTIFTFLVCYSVLPMAGSHNDALNASVWKRSYYDWQDSTVAKISRGALLTGLGAFTTGALLKKYSSDSAAYVGGAFACAAAGVGLFLYSANQLMQTYRQLLYYQSPQQKTHRLQLIKESLKTAALYRGTVKGDIDLNVALNNFSTWCDVLKNVNPLEQRDARLRPINVSTLKQHLERVTSSHMQLLNGSLINPQDVTGSRILPTNDLIYVQREIPSQKITYYSWGDLHGDVSSLVKTLSHTKLVADNWKITNPLVKFVFCGDFVDRGKYGVEVLQTLLKLKLTNPDQVMLVRGNHEDIVLGDHELHKDKTNASFHGQLRSLYRQAPMESLAQFYGSLPVALFVKTNKDVVQFCHGGIEPAYTPAKLLGHAGHTRAFELITHKNLQPRAMIYKDYCDQELQDKSDNANQQERATFSTLQGWECDRLKSNHTQESGQETSVGPRSMGLLWNYFNSTANSGIALNGGLTLGTMFTSWYFKTFARSQQRFIIRRAHQHTGKQGDEVGQGLHGGDGMHVIKTPQYDVITHVTTPLGGNYTPCASYIAHVISPNGVQNLQHHQVQ